MTTRADLEKHLAETEARVEAAERSAAKAQRKRIEKAEEPRVKLLEKVARGIVKMQEVQQTHALKQRVGRLDRAVRGYHEYTPDDAALALRDAADVAQRNAARNDAEVQSLANADRQTRWNAERTKIMRERFRLKREAEEEGRGYLEMPPLPSTAPDWYEREPDGVRVRVHEPSVPMPVLNTDGTVTLAFHEDVIAGRTAGPRLKTPEQQFAEAEGR